MFPRRKELLGIIVRVHDKWPESGVGKNHMGPANGSERTHDVHDQRRRPMVIPRDLYTVAYDPTNFA